MTALRLKNPAPLPPGGRLPAVDELKGVAMLLVILYHCGGIFGWPNWLHGEVGVDVFLIVSGFTLARGSATLPWRDFLRRRLLRVFPAYWVALAAFAGLGAHFFNSTYSFGNIAVHALGLHGFALTQPGYFSAINDSFWFISLILLMYLVFLGLRRHLADLARVIGTGLLLSAATCWIYLEVHHTGGLNQLATRVPAFFLGLVGAQLLGASESELRPSPLLAAGLLAVTYLGWIHGVILFYAFVGPAVVLVFLAARSSLLKHPDGRFALGVLGTIGIYSYEIFLFHQPLIRDYNRLFWSRAFDIAEPTPLQLALGVAGGLAVTFAVSWGVHTVNERLFRRAPSASAAAHLAG
jgi:peptidoglycan/LPS O-acetylase OafA/YrhL